MERWAQVKHLHQAVVDLPPEQRAAVLEAECGDDEGLRREVESLLAYQEAAEPFMEASALDVAARGMAQEPARSLVGRTLGPYHVQSLLGSGGMGEVYLARDPRLERSVALKVLPPDLTDDAGRMDRFVRETRAASALNHANVATVYDVGESDGVRFIVMEYVEGETLAACIGSRSLTTTEIVNVAVQVADALEGAHVKGITHRDIKPSNVMLTPRGQVKVLDFGVAKMASHSDRGSSGDIPRGTQTAAGNIVGSVPYMSPEQVSGRDVDARSDLFSLGATLYELAAGKPAFGGATVAETMERILQAQPEPMGGADRAFPDELERVIRKCLEKESAQRYQSASEVLADLRRLQRQTDDMVAHAPTPRTNLPVPLTSFVGRQRETEEIRRLVEHARLVTLTGAGGCGKTRLALHVASGLGETFRDGVWMVDLGPLSEPTLVPHTVAAAVGIREGPHRSAAAALIDYFRTRHALLILDNCEHLIAACAQFVDGWLRAASGLRVLATSREALGVPGEIVSRLRSMSTPDLRAPLAPAALLSYESARLFADRAAAVQPAFQITEANAPVIADVCRRLDGIPLAIELAAARLHVLSIDQISSRLNDRFRLLTGGSRTAVARQRTLEATIDWSYDLLSESERVLLHRLSVFPAGWTVEAAEEVCTGHGIDQGTVLDLLSNLVDKSLVSADDDPAGGRRYRCLETVRQYGRERLVRSGDIARVRDAHLRFFFELVQEAEPELIGAKQAAWLKRLDAEHDNLRSAMEWCLETRRSTDLALEMAAGQQWFWVKRGYLGEGRQWLERALATGDAAPAVTARALNGLASIAFFLGDYAVTEAVTERSLACAREADVRAEVASARGIQSVMAFESGDVARSVECARQCREAAVASGELWRQGPALECLAYQAMLQGDYQEARQFTGQALALSRQMGDTWGTIICVTDAALLEILQGNYTQAEEQCVEALPLAMELSDRLLTAFVLSFLAGSQAGLGRAVRAVRLWGAMHGLLDSVGVPLQPTHKAWIGDRFITPIEASLGEAAFQRALEEGRAMSWDRAVKYAMATTSFPGV